LRQCCTFTNVIACSYLWRQIVGRAAERPGDVWHLLGKSKIGNLQVPVPIEQQVLRLQVTVDDVERMQVIERQCDFCSVEFCHGIGEALRDR
jgi:hypothetical protein